MSRLEFCISNTNRSSSPAFALVEAVISVLIVGIMFVAVLSTVGASRVSQYRTSMSSQGHVLAGALMDEILSQDYVDPNGSSVFGAEPGESTTTRSDFDDVDDYSGWSSNPPTDKDGTELSHLAGWTRSVTVQRVNASDLAVVEGFESNVKRVTVEVSRDGAAVSVTALRTNSGL